MGKAYSFYDFIQNNGRLDNMQSASFDKTDKYRQIMNNPTRESQFLVIPTISNYQPPFIPDEEDEDENYVTLTIDSSIASFSFASSTVRVDSTGTYPKARLRKNVQYDITFSASPNYVVNQPLPATGIVFSSLAIWNVNSTTVGIRLSQNATLKITQSPAQSIPEEDRDATLTVTTTASITLVSGECEINNRSGGYALVAPVGKSFKVRISTADTNNIGEYNSQNPKFTLSRTPDYIGRAYSFVYTIMLTDDSDINIPVTSGNLVALFIDTDPNIQLSLYREVDDIHITKVNDSLYYINLPTVVEISLKIQTKDTSHQLNDITIASTTDNFLFERESGNEYYAVYRILISDTATITATSYSVETPTVSNKVLTIDASNCVVSSVSGYDYDIEDNGDGTYQISYAANTDFEFIVTPNSGYRIDSVSLIPAIFGDYDYTDLTNGARKYRINISSDCIFTVGTATDSKNVHLITVGEATLAQSAIDNGVTKTTTSNGYIITIPVNVSSFVVNIAIPDNYAPSNPAITGNNTVASQVIGSALSLNCTINDYECTLNVEFVAVQIEEWVDIETIFAPYWTNSSNGYYTNYGLSTYAIKTAYTPNVDYRFKFYAYSTSSGKGENIYPETVLIYPSNKNTEPTDSITAINNNYRKYTGTISEDDNAEKWVVLTEDIVSRANMERYDYLRIAFGDFKYFNGSNYSDSFVFLERAQKEVNLSPDAFDDVVSIGANVYFDGDSIVDIDITQEVDPTAETLPYSSYRMEIVDEADDYNPLSRKNKAYDFNKFQDFNIYTLARDPEGVIKETVSGTITTGNSAENAEWYIVPVARVKLNNIEQNNFNAVFNFIGIIEYYDNIYLNDDELKYSSHSSAMKADEYLYMLFGSDLDAETKSMLAESEKTIITPFKEESKAEIARIIAQYFGCYLTETTDGKIKFVKNTEKEIYNDEIYKVSLDNQYANPYFEQIREWYDSISIIANNYRNNTYSDSTLSDVKYSNILVYGQRTANADWEFLGDFVLRSDEAPNVAGYNAENLNDIYVDVGVDLEDVLANYDSQGIKFHGLKIKLEFEKDYITDSIYFKPASFVSESWYENEEKKNLYSADFNSLVKRIMDSSDNLPRVEVAESYINLYVYRGDRLQLNVPFIITTIRTYINISTTLTNSAMLMWFYICGWSILGYLGTAKGAEVSSATTEYLSMNEADSQNKIEIQNPLITSVAEARSIKQIIKNMYNNNTHSISGDWVGDGTLELNKKVLVGFPMGRGADKTYENYYLATIVKNEISSQGGFTQATGFNLYPEKMYQREKIVNGEYVTESTAVTNHTYNSTLGEEISWKAGDNVVLGNGKITI